MTTADLPDALKPAAAAIERALAALQRAQREGHDLLLTGVIDPRSPRSVADWTRYSPSIDAWRDAQHDVSATLRVGLIAVLVRRTGKRSIIRVEGAGGTWEQRS